MNSSSNTNSNNSSNSNSKGGINLYTHGEEDDIKESTTKRDFITDITEHDDMPNSTLRNEHSTLLNKQTDDASMHISRDISNVLLTDRPDFIPDN